jgi:hypothetical protein
MKRLFFLAFVAFAAWYAWHHWRDLAERRAKHEAIVENHSGRAMERVRLGVGSQTFVKETIADGSSAIFPFLVDQDATFQLEWKWPTQDFDQHWSGGMVPRGPMIQRHHFVVESDGAVIYQAEQKLGP